MIKESKEFQKHSKEVAIYLIILILTIILTPIYFFLDTNSTNKINSEEVNNIKI